LDLDLKSHPLALALLASELLKNREIAVLEKCRQFCDYLSRSLGRIQVELWVFCPTPKPRWACAGTHNGKEPKLREAIETSGSSSGGLFGEKTWISDWIQSPTGEKLGKLALYAQGIGAMDSASVEDFGITAVGLLKSAQLFFARTTP
jgi:hypothetical protein